MADQTPNPNNLNMGALNLNGGAGEPRSYIPPHMRGQAQSRAAPAANGGPAPAGPGLAGSAWAPTPAGYVRIFRDRQLHITFVYVPIY